MKTVVKKRFSMPVSQERCWEREEAPKDLVPFQPKPVKVNSCADLPECQIPLYHGKVTNGMLVAVPNLKTSRSAEDAGDVLSCGPGHVEKERMIYKKKDNGDLIAVTDAKVQVALTIEKYHNDLEFDEFLVSDVVLYGDYSVGKPLGRLEVSKEEFLNLYSLIAKKFPEAFVSKSPGDAFASYLSYVYKEKCKAIEVQTYTTGWFSIRGRTFFSKGINEESSLVKIPEVQPGTETGIFQAGIRYLEVGHGNPAICVTFLFSMLGYSKYFLERSHINVRFVCFLRGSTGRFKTSTVEPLCVPFDFERKHARTAISSTQSSIEDMMALQDGAICFDDFNTSEAKYAKTAKEHFEDVIRAVGDGYLRAKKNLKTQKVMSRSVRPVVFVTGEGDPSLSLSSFYRMVTIPIEDGTFDPGILKEFQIQPSIVQNFFGLYLKFLAESGKCDGCEMWEMFTALRQKYSSLNIARYADAAAVLEIQAQLLYRFGIFAGVDKEFMDGVFLQLVGGIVELLNWQAVEKKEAEPLPMFMEALVSKNFAGCRIANSVQDYNCTPGIFDGVKTIFREKAAVCVIQDVLFKNVRNYWGNIGRQFPFTDKEMKEKLADANLIQYIPGSARRSAEYTFKIPGMAGRTRMMVFFEDALNEFSGG